MSSKPRRFWVAGQPAGSNDLVEVRNPYDGSLVAVVARATAADVEKAVTAAADTADDFGASPAHLRAAALDHVAVRLRERSTQVAQTISAESGKPVKWARMEVVRAASTFRWAAEETRRWSGTVQRLDTDPTSEGRLALVRRTPRGPVLGITPFNFPLNLVAHKVAPALAVGAPIIIKPAPATPLSSLILGEFLSETSLPPGSWSVLPMPNDMAPPLVHDARLPVVSFTGSVPVGWQIREAVPRKHVTLELGGNAAVVVCPDWKSDRDLAHAADRIATFGMYQAGQSCIAVQRIYIHKELFNSLRDLVITRVEQLGTGSPADERTDVGPLINIEAATRVEQWVSEAVDEGATLLTGHRDGATYAPTVLTDVPDHAKVRNQEVFGPVIIVEPVDSIEEAFELVNDSQFGLQAGVFTHDLHIAFAAARSLEVGGVIIGDVPSYRADQLPYGGLKDSGTGREGVRAAMEDLTEERVLVLTDVAV